jgi:hypothetical protein
VVSESPLLYTSSGMPTDRCECCVCGEVFSTGANFDRHQRHRGNEIMCLPPGAVGLILDPRGWWHRPGPTSPVLRHAHMVERPQAPSTGNSAKAAS